MWRFVDFVCCIVSHISIGNVLKKDRRETDYKFVSVMAMAMTFFGGIMRHAGGLHTVQEPYLSPAPVDPGVVERRSGQVHLRADWKSAIAASEVKVFPRNLHSGPSEGRLRSALEHGLKLIKETTAPPRRGKAGPTVTLKLPTVKMPKVKWPKVQKPESRSRYGGLSTLVGAQLAPTRTCWCR